MADVVLGLIRDYWKETSDNIEAHDAADTGNPNKIGGKASDVAPTAVAVGDRTNAWFDLNGRLIVKQDQALPAGTNNIGDVDLASAIPAGTNLMGKVGIDQTTPGTTNGVQINAALPAGTNNIGDVDIVTIPALVAGTAIIGKVGIDQTTPGTTNGIQVVAALPAGTNNIGDIDVLSLPSLPAGTNNIGDVDVLTLPALNVDGTALVSAARTETTSSADLTNSWGKGICIVLDVTAVATSDVKVKIEGKDPVSGKYYTILESASVTTITTNVYKVYPALTAATNLVANDIVPKTFRITVTPANANSTTYSVGYSLV